jgi:competence protein ComEA
MRSIARWSMAGIVLSPLLLLATAVQSADATAEPSATTEARVVGVVNLNTATPEQLELLPGIGGTRARAIVEYRKEHGPFKQVDDLLKVSGIGPRALEQIRAHCTVDGKTTARLE